MSKRQALEAALAAWREAERRLVRAGPDEIVSLALEAQLRRDHFQRLSAEHMADRIDALERTEAHRRASPPQPTSEMEPEHVTGRLA